MLKEVLYHIKASLHANRGTVTADNYVTRVVAGYFPGVKETCQTVVTHGRMSGNVLALQTGICHIETITQYCREHIAVTTPRTDTLNKMPSVV